MLGQETDKVTVCVGQKVGGYDATWLNTLSDSLQAINERIKELDFRDCKVRVTNVDSQASDANIVIQVIGEISNKSQPHKKFTQTFVLAGQTNGYFVLNDIFRYIIEEEQAEEPVVEQATAGLEEPAPTAVTASAPEHANETLTSSQDPAAVEASAHKVDEELEQKVEPSQKEEAPAGKINGIATPPAESLSLQMSDAPAAAPIVEDEAPKQTLPDVQSQTLEPEKPKDPEPTPIASPKKPAAKPAAAAASAAPAAAAAASQAPTPAPSKQPAVPKTWANLAAAAARVTPAVPAPQPANTATSSAQSSKPAPVPVPSPAAQSTQSPAPASTAAAAPEETSSSKQQEDEWTSVGDHKKQQSRAQGVPGAQEGSQNRAYIKGVSESIDQKDLRAALEKYGEITYIDIHRQKVR